MVQDARVWVKAPWQTYNNVKKIKHPDMPKKPLTPFFRYFMEKREKMGRKHPHSSVTDLAKLLSQKFQTLNEKKKQKYKDAYDKEYEEYKQKLQQFKIEHPEVELGNMNKQQISHGHITEGPPKPKTPYQLFQAEKLKKETTGDTKKDIESIRAKWTELSEGKKIKWIRRALQDQQRYEAEVLEYIKEHPSFEPNKLRPILSKAEKELKDKYDGKPEKPPNSGYSLYSKMLLRQLQGVPSKEKMVEIGRRWKDLNEEEKAHYNKEAQKAMSRYVEKFEQYISHLPESERTKAVNENKFKLPSEKKLTQQPVLQADKLLTSPVYEDPAERDNMAFMLYQQERLETLRQKYPAKRMPELLRLTVQEWKEKLNDKKKAKYYKQIEPALMASSVSPNRSSKDRKTPAYDFLKREPKRPPKSGYALYTSEKLSTLTAIEPKRRMQEIARMWNQIVSKDEKEDFDRRNKLAINKYKKELNDFVSSLTPYELEEYNKIQNERKPKSKGEKALKAKAASDPVVDDSNVLETIDVATSNANLLEEASEEESNSDQDSDQDSEQEAEPAQEQATSDEEESESDSDGDDSDSGSGSEY